jgi:hypothetical protein
MPIIITVVTSGCCPSVSTSTIPWAYSGAGFGTGLAGRSGSLKIRKESEAPDQIGAEGIAENIAQAAITVRDFQAQGVVGSGLARQAIQVDERSFHALPLQLRGPGQSLQTFIEIGHDEDGELTKIGKAARGDARLPERAGQADRGDDQQGRRHRHAPAIALDEASRAIGRRGRLGFDGQTASIPFEVFP